MPKEVGFTAHCINHTGLWYIPVGEVVQWLLQNADVQDNDVVKATLVAMAIKLSVGITDGKQTT